MDDNKTEKKQGGGRGIMIAVVLVVAAAAGGGGWFLSQQQGGASAHEAKGEEGKGGEAHSEGGGKAGAQFVALDPAFVVNMADEADGRYLQVEVQLMSRDEKAQETIEHYAPMLRNKLLMLFGQQKSDQLRTREEKERLQAQALDEVRKTLEAETGRPVVQALFFTSFVMQ